MERSINDLRKLQALPLNLKVKMTEQRIRQWVEEFGVDGVYISFSGGKDSTVLMHIARKLFPSINAVFVDTGLEFPEIREFARSFENVEFVKPKNGFKKVIEEHGYPIISKDVAQSVYDARVQAKYANCDVRETKLWHRSFDPESDYAKRYPEFSKARYDFLCDAPFKISHMCCNITKKSPSKEYEKRTGRKPILATMACESRLRQSQWLHAGCNAFDVKRPVSKPMSFWTEQDVLQYIVENGISICSVYGDIVPDGAKSQCVAGQMKLNIDGTITESECCLRTTGASRTGCMFCMFGCTQPTWKNFVRMKETHPKQYEWIMKPWEDGGLGYKTVIDWLNEHGNMHIEY